MSFYKPVLFVILCCLAAGCGGGGGGGGSTAPLPPGPPAPGVAHFTISDPYGATGAVRAPKYFSTATAGIIITAGAQNPVELALSPSSANCSISGASINCSIDLPVANGLLTYAVQTVDQYQRPLSLANGSILINGTTTVPLALSGIVKFAHVHVQNPNLPMGAPGSTAVSVTAYDPAGALIIGPEPYSPAVPIYNSDTTGATSLSSPAIAKPGDTVTLSYDGTSYVNAYISAINQPVVCECGYQGVLVPSLRNAEYVSPSHTQTSTNSYYSRIFPNADGTLTFLENNALIGRVTTSGIITEIPVPKNYYDIVGGPDGNTWVLAQTSPGGPTAMDRVNPDRSVSVFPLPQFAFGNVTVGADGNFWVVAPSTTFANEDFFRVTPSGTVTTFDSANAGNSVQGGVLANDGNLWFVSAMPFATTWNFLRVAPDGTVTFYPFTVSQGSRDDWPAFLGPDQAIYTFGQNALERITTAGVMTSTPLQLEGGTAMDPSWDPNPMVFGPDGVLWIATTLYDVCNARVQRVAPNGAVTYLQLPSPCGNPVGFPEANAIRAFTFGPDGNLWYTREDYVGKIILK